GLLRDAHVEFAEAGRSVMKTHFEESEIQAGLTHLAEFSNEAVQRLRPHVARYDKEEADQSARLRETLFPAARPGAFGLLRDLQNLVVMASQSEVMLTSVLKTAQELRDEALLAVCGHLQEQTKRRASSRSSWAVFR